MAKRYGTVKFAGISMNEDRVQELVVQFLRLKYPKVAFQANYLSGVKLPIGLAAKAKRLGHEKATPDLMIFKPMGDYHGLFVELKAQYVKIYKKDASGYSKEHYREQADKLYTLIQEGYCGVFSNGFEESTAMIEDYMSGNHKLLKETIQDFAAAHLAIANK